MLISINRVYGEKLAALDGDIGHVKDFYFDDQNWAIRYVVVDTGAWLPGRQVLLSPHAFGGLHLFGKHLLVNLSRQQIEASPGAETHKPLSRKFEEEYYQYYGWPYYWQGDSLWGASAFPVMEPHATPRPARQPLVTANFGEGADEHLRSSKEVGGYRVQGTSGLIGEVCDFMIDGQSWAIRQVAYKTGLGRTAIEVQMPTSEIDRISYDESAIIVNGTTRDLERNAPGKLFPVETVL